MSPVELTLLLLIAFAAGLNAAFILIAARDARERRDRDRFMALYRDSGSDYSGV